MLEAIWVFLGLIVVSGLMYLLATYVFGRGEELAPMPADATPMVLPPARDLTGVDVREVRLPVAFRGYRMTEVDALLDRIAEELDRDVRGDFAPVADEADTGEIEVVDTERAGWAPDPSTPDPTTLDVATDPEQGADEVPSDQGWPAQPDTSPRT